MPVGWHEILILLTSTLRKVRNPVGRWTCVNSSGVCTREIVVSSVDPLGCDFHVLRALRKLSPLFLSLEASTLTLNSSWQYRMSQWGPLAKQNRDKTYSALECLRFINRTKYSKRGLFWRTAECKGLGFEDCVGQVGVCVGVWGCVFVCWCSS